MKAGNIIENQLRSTLPGLIKPILDRGSGLGNAIYLTVNGLDGAVDLVVDALVEPLADVLYPLLLAPLTNSLGALLTANTDQEGDLLGFLGAVLNPWNVGEANAAIVIINDFPRSMDFDLQVQDFYPDGSKFRFNFTDAPGYDEKDIVIKGFSGLFDIREIDVASSGLISGLVIDVVDEGLLLNGTFVNIEDPLSYTPETNRRYESNYSFLDLGLKDYAIQEDGTNNLSVSTALGSIAGGLGNILEDIPLLGDILSPLLGALLSPLSSLTISVPVNVPLLAIDNLKLSGEWSAPMTF